MRPERLDQLANLAFVPQADADPALVAARVLSCDEDNARVQVEFGGASHQAQIAVACLIRPLPEDRVLLFRSAETLYVLSVLERIGPNYATLALPGHGNLALEGETLSLTARQRMSLKAGRLDLQTRALAFIADKTTWLGKEVTSIVERWRLSAKTHEVSADSLLEKAVNRTAIIDQVDMLRAQTRSVAVSGIASETAQSKVVAVSDDLRMDGKRITMG